MKKTVMVVDDDRDNVESVRMLLEGAGYSVISAYDGDECLEVLKKGKSVPDLILLDIMMPGMTAIEVVRAVRKDKRTKSVKIAYFTSVSATEREKKELVKQGYVVDFIEKPFDINDLLARVKKAVG